jgi:hypothetical protein
MQSKIKLGVSLYSYQVEYLTGQMSLEECIEAVADMGADGIEIIPQSMIPNCFNLPAWFLDQWFGWMARYGTKPVAIDSFCDENKLYAKLGRDASFEEAVAIQKKYIDLASQLGCRYIRAQIRTTELYDALVPYAEEKNVFLGREIHGPGVIKSRMVDEIIEYIARTGTRHLGLIPDFGIWQFKAPPVVLDMLIRDGASRSLVEYAQELCDQKMDAKAVADVIQAKGGNALDLSAARRICTNSYDNPEHLRGIIPYVLGIHGKFWDIGEDLQESCIDYENPIRILLEEGFDGYINSEYEGNRHVQDLGPVRGVEQVRRHHAMIRAIIGKYAAK